MSIAIDHNWGEKNWDWPLQHNDDVVKVINTQDKFEVGLDAQHFTPSEIQVKVVGGLLDIQFEHNSRNDVYGSISRSVARTYKLPDDVDTSSIKSSLNARGTLIITASKKH